MSCYDALLRACLVERAWPIPIGEAVKERRAWSCVVPFDVAHAVAANEACLTVAAGNVVGEHLDGHQFGPDTPPVFGARQLAVDNAACDGFQSQTALDGETA